jgi:hypothetical protein
MNITVLSYSFTGNNDRYAEALSIALNARHVRVKPKHAVNFGSITLDLIFSRKPEIEPNYKALRESSLVLLVAPVWMGQPAFPLRRCMDALKSNTAPYGFLTICGGSDAGNPMLEGSILQRVGRAPVLVHQQRLSSIIPSSPTMSWKEVKDYQLSDAECDILVGNALQAIKKEFPEI